MLKPKRETTFLSYKEIQQHHAKLLNKTELGVRKYSPDYCIAVTAKKFHKSFETTKKIVYSQIEVNSL